jgi:hypothetical protein
MVSQRRAIGRRLRRRRDAWIRRFGECGQWLRRPVQNTRTVIVAVAMMRRAPERAVPVFTAELVDVAERVHTLGLRRLAAALLHHPTVVLAAPATVIMARRRMQAAAAVPAPVIERAFSLATGQAGRPATVAEPQVRGKGRDVEAVVRLKFPSARFSMICKTLRGQQPRELAAYTSSLFAGGVLYRIPTLYHFEAEQPDRWHLFLEDLGRLERLKHPADLVLAAQALGEFNGRSLDRPEFRQHRWLTGRGWIQPGFTELFNSSNALEGLVPNSIRRRLGDSLVKLSELEPVLLEREGRAPVALRHGDPNTGNVAVRDGKVIMFDLSSCRLEPLGRDLANLLGVTNLGFARQPDLVDACRSAYLDGVRQSGSSPDETEVDFVYRLQFVRLSAWWLFRFIPLRLPASPPGGDDQEATGLRQRRLNISAKTVRLCDEADRLIQSVS